MNQNYWWARSFRKTIDVSFFCLRNFRERAQHDIYIYLNRNVYFVCRGTTDGVWWHENGNDWKLNENVNHFKHFLKSIKLRFAETELQNKWQRKKTTKMVKKECWKQFHLWPIKIKLKWNQNKFKCCQIKRIIHNLNYTNS